MSPKKRQTRRPATRPQAARAAAPSRRTVRPLPQGEVFFTPGATGTRAAMERLSAKPLVYLHQMPRWVMPVLLAALMVAGLAASGPVGALALALVAAFLGWLGYLSWPSLTPGKRAIRLVTTLALVGLAVVQLVRF